MKLLKIVFASLVSLVGFAVVAALALVAWITLFPPTGKPDWHQTVPGMTVCIGLGLGMAVCLFWCIHTSSDTAKPFPSVMKVWVLRLAALAVVAFQMLWVSQFRNYSFPRGSEWRKAYAAYEANPSPENREELTKQTKLNGQRNRMVDEMVNGVLVVADLVMVVYFSWKWLTKMDERGTKPPP